jgi:ornithine carbamoyltransferase
MQESATMNKTTLGIEDLISMGQLDAAAIGRLFETAAAMKADPSAYAGALRGKAVVMLFEKPSLRTRVTFEVGVGKMGGLAMYFDHASERIGQREPVRDYAKNLERWVECIVARTHGHGTIQELAEHASIPVVNALSDHEHPCQALADLFTLHERFGRLSGLRLAFVGDGNNVCHSLMLGAATLGVDITVITPEGFAPDAEVVRAAGALAVDSGSAVAVTTHTSAVAGHHAVYTDKWVSMGQDGGKGGAFAAYRVDAAMMRAAGEGIAGGAVFMHCLPAKRGEEVAAEVIDSPASVVYDQAENRMHVQDALLWYLLGEGTEGQRD